MLDTRPPQSVRRSDAFRLVRDTMAELLARTRQSPDADMYGAIHDEWVSRLVVAEGRNQQANVSTEVATAVRDLVESARSAADEEAIADWLDLLPQSTLSLTHVSPSVAAYLMPSLWPLYERLTNARDAQQEESSPWEPQTQHGRRPLVAA